MNWSLRPGAAFLVCILTIQPVSATDISGGHVPMAAIGRDRMPYRYTGRNVPDIAQKQRLRSVGDRIKLERPAKTALCPGSDALVLKAPELPATYTWYWNGTMINGLNTNVQVVSQPGYYYARVRNNTTGSETLTDTITLTKAENPIATLTAATPGGTLCERDSLRLTAGGGIAYQWFFNGAEIGKQTRSTLFAKQAGRYSVMVTDTNGCRASSGPLTVSRQTRPKPIIDSIPAICGTDNPPVNLRASPGGGIFSGPGITGSSFDPKLAGLGVHTLTYQAPRANGCAGDSSHRFVRVIQPPIIQLSAQIVTSNQGIVSIDPTITGNGPFSYNWQPTTWLSNSTQATPTVAFPKHDTTYTVRVQDVFGCTTTGSIRIIVKSAISIPDAFTPNNDHMNDTWKLPGIESFPQAQLTIMNRWGEVVFHSYEGYISAFDGQYNGEPLPMGMYLYVLKLSPEAEPMRGSVWLVR